MATSMASVAAHAHPPFPLPAVPRVRPPPIPKRTPGPNTLPVPSENPPAPTLVWADGTWRSRLSNAVKHKSETVSRQLEKALRHEVHGMNIYAYKHLQTNQVVYSLTKNMDNNKILKQLIFHGKKTVPRALRRDVWRPYFSIHFPKTPGGAAKGLSVFRELRELSLRRQLKPPKEMVVATEEDIEKIKKKYRPYQLKNATEKPSTKRGAQYERLDMPIVGMRLPKKMIARRLMNQRATSVADVAAVLKRHVMARPASSWERKRGVEEDALLTPKELIDKNEAARKIREAGLSSRNHKRLADIRKEEAKKAEAIELRKDYVKPRPGYTQLQRHTTDRISMEYEGLMYIPQEGMDLKLFNDADDATRMESGAERALDDAIDEMEEEKEMQRETIEKEISAQIEQQLANMTEEQRSLIQQDVEQERAEKEEQIERKIADQESRLKSKLEKLYAVSGAPPSGGSLATFRRVKRENTARIAAMKIDERRRHLKWVGPYAEINDKVNEALAEIEARWQPKLDALREEVEKEAAYARRAESHEVEIRWADMRDGTHAREWPDSVFHGELQPKAVVKAQKSVIREHAHFDVDELSISEQRADVAIPTSTSIHVFGTEEVDDPATARWQSPQYLAQHSAELRGKRIDKWSTTETILMRRRIVALRAENRKLQAHFAGSVLDAARMGWTAALIGYIEDASEHNESLLSAETYDQNTIAKIEGHMAYVAENLKWARNELARSDDPDADRARHDWIANSADLIKLESTHLEARRQADLREEFLGKFDERERLLDEITEGIEGADKRLESFDERFPFVNDVMARHGIAVEGEAMKAAFEDIEETHIAQQQVLRDRKETLQAARAALQEAEANHPSTDGSDLVPVADAKAELQRAMTGVVAAEEVINETRAKRMDIIQQIQAKSSAMRNDREAWREFKERGGTVGIVSATRWTREEGTKVDEGGKEKERDDVVVVEPTRGVWERVKGLFGRK